MSKCDSHAPHVDRRPHNSKDPLEKKKHKLREKSHRHCGIGGIADAVTIYICERISNGFGLCKVPPYEPAEGFRRLLASSRAPKARPLRSHQISRTRMRGVGQVMTVDLCQFPSPNAEYLARSGYLGPLSSDQDTIRMPQNGA